MTKGRTGDEQILERIEAIIPAIIEVLRNLGCFAGLPEEKDNLLLSIFEALAIEQGISLYATLKFFYEQPQILRLYNLFAWLTEISQKYGDNNSVEIVLIAFYEVCRSVIPLNIDLDEADKEKRESLLRSPAFRDVIKLQSIEISSHTRLNLP